MSFAELAICELCAVIWNVFKIVLGVIVYEYVSALRCSTYFFTDYDHGMYAVCQSVYILILVPSVPVSNMLML